MRTSRNMAYYPPEMVERVALIKRLQEERFMPLRMIKGVLEEDPERVRAWSSWRIASSSARSRAEEGGRTSARSARALRDPAQRARAPGGDRRADADRRGYEHDDVKIIEAIASFRAGGYEEALGFTVYDTLRYREALEPLVREEVRALLDRLAGEVEIERALEIVAAGAEPLRELIGAMHSKLLLAELRRQRKPRSRIAGPAGPARPGYQRARWCSTTPSPCASGMPPGSIPLNEPNGAR